ncbi:hypothetical protein [Yersinia pseudotuberculosis]|uniref:hypothetical protein n=1 Tax=Yersinia pseudotuberculosis TaxID=633 RepID=UPI0005E39BD6|nr:hypothetical protein [Yersinia pseudotuberculosis]MBO1591275.1 hypothetical protein [Yersinia pseudotuberculosis]CNE29865.1 Uncharacterised protein [Yersinia pseudotuberculosis]
MTSKKDSPKKYDLNSRRTTTFQKGNKASTGKKNALGGNPNKRARDIEIAHDYVVFMSTEKEPLQVMMQYKGESLGWYVSICKSMCNDIAYIEFGYLIEHLHDEFHKRKMRTFGRNLNHTEKEAVTFLSEKYYLSQEAISSILSKYRTSLSEKGNAVSAIIHLSPKRIYLQDVTHQQHLESEYAHIDYMESVTISDIQEQQYKNEKDRQLDIENMKQHFNELRQALTQLERRAKEDPSGKAYINSSPPHTSHLHDVLRSKKHKDYEIDRLEWMKNLKNK